MLPSKKRYFVAEEMLMYNFDEAIPRTGTNSYKYDFAHRFGRPADSLPMWVADMDFRIPPEVTAAIQRVADHGIYGYTDVGEDYFRAVANWYSTRHDYNVKPEWLVKVPGIVYALAIAIRATTAPGDAIIIQKPLYPPIENTIVANGRIAIDNTLIYENGRYTIDLADFEQKIVENNARMFILCSPHNPGGRVWTREELLAMGRICKKHNCLVVSDEIHCDLVFGEHKHLVFSTVAEEFADTAIICTSPSKTFNLAGLQTANIFIANEGIREKFVNQIWASGYSQLNTMGLAACQAAYEHGAPWLNALMEYLTTNAAFVQDYLAKNAPKVRAIKPEGSYLMWLDMNALGLTHQELEARMDTARIWLSSGTAFGATGAGFFRVNLACPMVTLVEGMKRVVEAIVN